MLELTLINLTTHPVIVYAGDRSVASWPPSGGFARLEEVLDGKGSLATDQGEVPGVRIRYSERVADLPEPRAGTAYIVSRVLAAAVARDDLYFPYDEVRDADGRIVGCRALGQFVHDSGGHDAG
jgi:hypothetical protein